MTNYGIMVNPHRFCKKTQYKCRYFVLRLENYLSKYIHASYIVARMRTTQNSLKQKVQFVVPSNFCLLKYGSSIISGLRRV